MDQDEIVESREDPEIEITDLDEMDAGKSSSRFFTRSWLLSRKYRKPVTIATSAFIVLAMLLLLLSITPLRLLFRQAPPVTEQTSFSLRLDANPPWGHLTVDGKSVALISSGAYPLFSVSRGRHTLTWYAAPFSPQQCVISMPTGSGPDTCEHPIYVPDSQDSTRTYIAFAANLSILPAKQRAALIQVAQTALDRQQSSETVRVGELYALIPQSPGSNLRLCTPVSIAALCFATADQPLQARLSMQLDTSTSSSVCSPGACWDNGQDCSLFCDVPGSSPNSDVNRAVWQPSAAVHVYWQFVSMSGRVIAANVPDTFILGAQNEQQIQLNIRWNGTQWSVAPINLSSYDANNNPVCNAAYNDLYTLALARMQSYDEAQPVPGPTPASGCLIKILLNSGPDAELTPTATPPTAAYVIQRFGVLLAVNATAHHLWPFLPVADAYAQKVAQQSCLLAFLFLCNI